MHWSDIEHAQHRLARLGHQRLIEPGVVLVATIRQDGTATVTDLLERPLSGAGLLPVTGGRTVELSFRPFQILTLRLTR